MLEAVFIINTKLFAYIFTYNLPFLSGRYAYHMIMQLA